MTKVHLRRLLKLADYLDTVPRKEFDYTEWGVKTPCGTTACALGHALLGPFKRYGYKLVFEWADVSTYATVINKQGKSGFQHDAITDIFGIGTHDLFYPEEGELKATPKQVAKKIRKFVKERS